MDAAPASAATPPDPAAAPTADEVARVKAWLKLADYAKAWDVLLGKRIHALRKAKQAAGKAATPMPRRGAAGWTRDPSNFSQDAVAQRLGLTQSWLAKIEQGNRALTVAEAYLIARALGVPAADGRHSPFSGPGRPTESDDVTYRGIDRPGHRAGAISCGRVDSPRSRFWRRSGRPRAERPWPT